VPPGEEADARRPAGGQPPYDVRYFLAEERTFLAWIRTILGVMAFGFLAAHVDRVFLSFGTALIATGVALILLTVRRHRRVVEALNHPQAAAHRPSRQGIFLALVLAVAGVGMAIHLIRFWSSPA
jgi:putative membrane protein